MRLSSIHWEYDAHRCPICWCRLAWYCWTDWWLWNKRKPWKWLRAKMRQMFPPKPDSRHVARRENLHPQRDRIGVVCDCCLTTHRAATLESLEKIVRIE